MDWSGPGSPITLRLSGPWEQVVQAGWEADERGVPELSVMRYPGGESALFAAVPYRHKNRLQKLAQKHRLTSKEVPSLKFGRSDLLQPWSLRLVETPPVVLRGAPRRWEQGTGPERLWRVVDTETAALARLLIARAYFVRVYPLASGYVTYAVGQPHVFERRLRRLGFVPRPAYGYPHETPCFVFDQDSWSDFPSQRADALARQVGAPPSLCTAQRARRATRHRARAHAPDTDAQTAATERARGRL